MRVFSRWAALQQPHPPAAPAATPTDDELRRLIAPISRGNQDAFIALVDHTRGHVYARLESRLHDEQLAAMVLAATYVEVWWLAGCHHTPDLDVLAWINQIADRRAGEAPHHAAPTADGTRDDAFATRARWATRELATLLERPAGTVLSADAADTVRTGLSSTR